MDVSVDGICVFLHERMKKFQHALVNMHKLKKKKIVKKMANLSVALLKPVSIFISECARVASAKNVAACIVALTDRLYQ